MKTKILFVIENLRIGGAERIIRNLAENFSSEKFDRTLILLNHNDKESHYAFPDNTNVRILDCSKLNALPKLVRVIHELKPDIVLSALTVVNLISLLAKLIVRNDKIKFVVRETTIKSFSLREKGKNIFTVYLIEFLIKKLYPKANGIVALSHGCKKDLVESYGINENQIRVIYNPIDVKKITALTNEILKIDDEITRLIIVGSLVKSKGHEYLLRAVSVLKNKGYLIECTVIGNGVLHEDLKVLSRDLDIENEVKFLGFCKEPYDFIASSDIFVLPALWEGFGNVIIEAMASRTCVISTYCESGPKEIITSGLNGLLVQPRDVDGLVDSIEWLILNPSERRKIETNALLSSKNYEILEIVKEYEEYVRSL